MKALPSKVSALMVDSGREKPEKIHSMTSSHCGLVDRKKDGQY